MEASSHALHQKRAAAIAFKIGVFTNLTGDHLDYHQTMDAYFDAKAMLFESLPVDGVAVINIDDPAGAAMAKRTRAKVLTCSLHDGSASCHANMGEQSLNSIDAMFVGPWGKFDACLPLVGAHNVINALQAAAVCHALGLDGNSLKQSLETCSAPPGRLEPVTGPKDSFAVLVDYAHTDDALDNVLRGLKPIVQAGAKLRVVFGCGGDRDRTKRPRMAKVACRWADEVIVTSDNPRTEDPQVIIDEIRAGVPEARLASTLFVIDREAAIHEAIRRTGDGDILLVAGKGHEDYQIIGTTKRPFDDRKVAAAALRRKVNMKAAMA
jgi:UDP-N-acetylmuramoyl-L-alanyl-D-glutamate--2,6-diaminopimelate ligase